MLYYKMPSFLFTFRAHVSEPNLFKTFLTIFFNSSYFESLEEYTYNIEKYGTLDAHLHIFFTTTIKTADKVYQKFSQGEFKQFSQYLKNKNTRKQYGFDVKPMKTNIKDRNHRLYTIGYCNKDAKHGDDSLPQTTYNIDDLEIIKGVEYYYEYTKLEKVKLGETEDIKVLTSKNAHAEIIQFIKEQGLEPTDELLYEKMSIQGLFTDFLSYHQKRNIQVTLDQYLTKRLYPSSFPGIAAYEKMKYDLDYHKSEIDNLESKVEKLELALECLQKDSGYKITWYSDKTIRSIDKGC